MVDYSKKSYDAVAEEYYDENLHPTCADFRFLSEIFFRHVVHHYMNPLVEKEILEVGGGDSLAAYVLQQSGMDLSKLLITDSSELMLEYSKRWCVFGARLERMDAEAISVEKSQSAIFCSLGDPYNNFSFWQSAFLNLEKNGLVVFTTPSYEWASDFRAKENKSNEKHAFFITKRGKVFINSETLDLSDQINLIRRAGFRLREFKALGFEKDKSVFAKSKKTKESKYFRNSIIWGFVAEKP